MFITLQSIYKLKNNFWKLASKNIDISTHQIPSLLIATNRMGEKFSINKAKLINQTKANQRFIYVSNKSEHATVIECEE